jgi:hypothetical protein
MGLSRVRKFLRTTVVAIVFSMTMLVALPAHALPILIIPPIFFLQGISGHVTDAGTTAAVKGVIVSAYNSSDDTYVWSAVTDASGAFSLYLTPGTYRVEYQDPLKRYGGQWYFDDTNFADGLDVAVTSATWSNADVHLHTAMTIKYIVRHADHPLAKVGGANVLLQQKDTSSSHIVMQSGVANSAGLVTFGGQRPQGVTYQATAIDTTGRFWTGTSTGAYLPFVGGTVNTVYIDLTAAGSSFESTVSVPASSKYTRSANVSFTVNGTITKRVTSPKTMKIVAVKGGTTKTFTAAITAKTSSSTYGGKVKLSKGTWTLFALFGGNSTLAPTDSGLVGRSVVVK